MNRPQSFYDLPYLVKERILDDCDLEYDPYEGSRDEAVADMLNNCCNSANKKIVENVYKNMSDYELQLRIEQQIKWGESQVESMKKMIRI